MLASLEKLRIAALEGLAAHDSPDGLLLWNLGGLWVTIKGTTNPIPLIANYQRPFRASVIDLGETVERGLGRVKTDRLESLPYDIRNRLEIASYWISQSVNHEENAHKIVDLCTALEAMLLPGERETPKADKIALRYHLLGLEMKPVGSDHSTIYALSLFMKEHLVLVHMMLGY